MSRPATDEEYAEFFNSLRGNQKREPIMVEIDLRRLTESTARALAAECPELAMLVNQLLVDRASNSRAYLNL
jgi:hypothetical protein